MKEDDLIHGLLMEHINATVMDARDAVRLCESPIERLLGLALYFGYCSGKSASFVDHYGGLNETEMQEMMEHPSSTYQFIVAPQVTVGPYRVDFFLCGKGYDNKGDCLSLVIECDGHDFHEKTKQQAMYDRSRDRALIRLGYHILRFTGAEIWADPWGCAGDACDAIGCLTGLAAKEFKASASMKP